MEQHLIRLKYPSPVIHELFPENMISQRDDINWPARSPDLTPMEEIPAITENICRVVLRNFALRLGECQQNNGTHSADIIKKKYPTTTVV